MKERGKRRDHRGPPSEGPFANDIRQRSGVSGCRKSRQSRSLTMPRSTSSMPNGNPALDRTATALNDGAESKPYEEWHIPSVRCLRASPKEPWQRMQCLLAGPLANARRKSTPPSPATPTPRTSTTAPTPSAMPSASPAHSRSIPFHPTAPSPPAKMTQPCSPQSGKNPANPTPPRPRFASPKHKPTSPPPLEISAPPACRTPARTSA